MQNALLEDYIDIVNYDGRQRRAHVETGHSQPPAIF